MAKPFDSRAASPSTPLQTQHEERIRSGCCSKTWSRLYAIIKGFGLWTECSSLWCGVPLGPASFFLPDRGSPDEGACVIGQHICQCVTRAVPHQHAAARPAMGMMRNDRCCTSSEPRLERLLGLLLATRLVMASALDVDSCSIGPSPLTRRVRRARRVRATHSTALEHVFNRRGAA